MDGGAQGFGGVWMEGGVGWLASLPFAAAALEGHCSFLVSHETMQAPQPADPALGRSIRPRIGDASIERVAVRKRRRSVNA